MNKVFSGRLPLAVQSALYATVEFARESILAVILSARGSANSRSHGVLPTNGHATCDPTIRFATAPREADEECESDALSRSAHLLLRFRQLKQILQQLPEVPANTALVAVHVGRQGRDLELAYDKLIRLTVNGG